MAALVLVFSFTSATVLWLAHDVDRSLSHRSSAQLLAYESARSGAQQIDIDVLRTESRVQLDPDAVAVAAHLAAARGFDRLDLSGSVTSIRVDERLVIVEVEIVDGGRRVRGRAAAEAENGVDP